MHNLLESALFLILRRQDALLEGEDPFEYWHGGETGWKPTPTGLWTVKEVGQQIDLLMKNRHERALGITKVNLDGLLWKRAGPSKIKARWLLRMRALARILPSQ